MPMIGLDLTATCATRQDPRFRDAHQYIGERRGRSPKPAGWLSILLLLTAVESMLPSSGEQVGPTLGETQRSGPRTQFQFAYVSCLQKLADSDGESEITSCEDNDEKLSSSDGISDSPASAGEALSSGSPHHTESLAFQVARSLSPNLKFVPYLGYPQGVSDLQSNGESALPTPPTVKLFLGSFGHPSLTGGEPFIRWLFATMAPKVKLYAVEIHTCRNDGRGQGSAFVWVDKASVHQAKSLHHRVFVDYLHDVQELGIWVLDSTGHHTEMFSTQQWSQSHARGTVESLRQLLEKRNADNHRNTLAPTYLLVVESAKHNTPLPTRAAVPVASVATPQLSGAGLQVSSFDATSLSSGYQLGGISNQSTANTLRTPEAEYGSSFVNQSARHRGPPAMVRDHGNGKWSHDVYAFKAV